MRCAVDPRVHSHIEYTCCGCGEKRLWKTAWGIHPHLRCRCGFPDQMDKTDEIPRGCMWIDDESPKARITGMDLAKGPDYEGLTWVAGVSTPAGTRASGVMIMGDERKWRKSVSRQISMDADFDTDVKNIQRILAIADWDSQQIDEWTKETTEAHKEMMNAMFMCPAGCLAVWNERPYVNRLATVSVMLMVMTSSVFGGFTLTEENDVFTGTDNYYTQGLELLWAGGARKYTDCVRHTGYGIRNVFYSPEDIEQSVVPSLGDRPWAGYLSVQRTDWKRTKKYTRRVDWVVGTVGEWSQSDHIQAWFHRITGSGKPIGWQHQIPSEPFVNVTLEYYRPLWAVYDEPKHWGFDLTGMGGSSLGTAFINGELGLACRAGWNLPAEGWSGLIRPTKVSRYSFYALAEQYGRVVSHNVMLGGSFFQDGEERELERLVSDMVVGAGALVRVKGTNVGLTYRRVWRSDEFKNQALPTDFGSICLSVTGAL